MASSALEKIVAMLRGLPREAPTRENIPLYRMQLEALAGRLPSRTVVDPAAGLDVPAQWIRCGDVDPDRRILYLHGGGYVSGSRVTHSPLAARISRASKAAVLLVEYRLAPEHPHPAAVDDALVALAWMCEHGPTGPGRAKRTFVAGDSAGGGLTLATLLATRDRKEPMPDAAVTLSAWTDLAATGDSVKTRAAADPMIEADWLRPAAAFYLAGTDARAPLASPFYGDMAGLPPLLMQVGDAEVLLDDTTRVAERAKRAGALVTMRVWPEMFHVFQAFAGMLPEGREAIDEIGAFLARF